MGKKHQGTCLGLALTKKIVQAQGGRVGVRSVLGKGSIFYAVLPKGAPIQTSFPAESPASPTSPAGRTILLIIEDNEKDLRWLVKILSEAGYFLETAMTGAEAVAKAEAKAYGAILLDLILPDMVGWDVLQSIRAKGPNEHAPVITISVVREKEAAKGFPIQDFLSKPIDAGILLHSLERAGVRPQSSRPEERFYGR
jgi:CheY-like chemotaxis protein